MGNMYKTFQNTYQGAFAQVSVNKTPGNPGLMLVYSYSMQWTYSPQLINILHFTKFAQGPRTDLVSPWHTVKKFLDNK